MLRNLKQFNPPEVEEKVLEFWKTDKIFEKSLAERAKKKTFVFYEGPPTANGRPGIHHVLGRAFKDVILRYKSMRGFYVPRRAGWDTHGLPVEVEVEKQLGIKTKGDIEKFGIDLFNQKAKETVWAYKDEWEKLTKRIGFWLDMGRPYITYENDYMESLWWIFGQIAKKKLLKKDYRVGPYCPRCETVLSAAELGQPGAYKKTTDPSVYVKFKLRTPHFERRTHSSGSRFAVHGSEYLLIWTTTPWTLPANVAIAVNPRITYTKFLIKNAKGKNEYLWSHNPPPEIFDAKVEVVEKISGKKLIGLEYEPLYKTTNSEQLTVNSGHKVLGADFISTEEGTGLVHIAPAFGEDDFGLIKARTHGFSYKDVLITVDNAGKMISGYPGAHKFVKDADNYIIADLESRNLLYKKSIIEHEYPFCWRCGTPLLYMARSSWFIEMSKLRKELLAANKKINWIPKHLKEGRFGEWIKEARDWAISRERYWGTPLPIWECGDCGEIRIAGGLDDLDKYAYHRNNFLLLRHTEGEHNLGNMLASGPSGKNVDLTAKGKKDAESLAKNLKNKKIDIIYTSPYKRTSDLANAIARATGVKIIADKKIEEINAGVFNGRPVPEHKKYFNSPLEEFTKTPPGGENLNDVKKRMFSFVVEVNKKHKDKNILIISHGDPLWVLEGTMRGLTNEEILSASYIGLGELREVALHNWPYDNDGRADMHRPFVDNIYLRCEKCQGKMSRVKEVADVWFDSGAMPFASAHYPFTEAQNQKSKILTRPSRQALDKNQKFGELAFPADYICEAIDQTRGWFYTLLAVAALLGKKEPYRNVISYGHVLDKYGAKMSKSKGNVVNPWDVIQKYGVDSVRWYFYTVNPPGEPKRFDEVEVKKTLNKFIMILYNSYVFYETYAEKRVISNKQSVISKNVLDKWILARLNQAIYNATSELEKYEIGSAAKHIENMIDDLSRWYIRRSRRRLQKPENAKDYEVASATLGFVLVETAKLIAPFAPFFAEALFQSLHGSQLSNAAPRTELRSGHGVNGQMLSSVHLSDWPTADKKAIDQKLIEGMRWVREIATQALAKRAEVGIKVRQPLAKLIIKHQVSSIKPEEELLKILKDEINVKEIVLDGKLENEVELDIKITPKLREEGLLRELTRVVQELRQNAGLLPKDNIALFIEARSLMELFGKQEGVLKKEVGAKSVAFKKTDKFDAEIETKIDGSVVWIGIRKM
ncbi:MAG: class I tRNA ligase family protein [Candidatus Liptonbacteria bacterium]|nr:class I tRNA ligase family protein [Candidatus Liptonbacteria bacterium]